MSLTYPLLGATEWPNGGSGDLETSSSQFAVVTGAAKCSTYERVSDADDMFD